MKFLRNIFKMIAEFAGIIYRNCCIRKIVELWIKKCILTSFVALEVTKIHSEKCGNKSRFLLQDNAPAHQPVFVKDFLDHNKVTTLEHLSTSELASALKQQFFCDATDIIKNL